MTSAADQSRAKLWVVTIEQTYYCDVVVAAETSAAAALLAERECDPQDGDHDGVRGAVQRVVESAADLHGLLSVDDEVDAIAPGLEGHFIKDFLEDEGVRTTRLHNEAMSLLQGRLF